ncbi:acyltransferase family protein [Vibrio rotiferianus]|uniref:acyltransferase family protein n=1 Tax=Vibrio rotiferianus TaxID=190895 RepID=UPI00406A8BFA
MARHISSIDNFRAIAIILVVAVHCMPYGMSISTGPWLIFQNLIYGSTAAFVFISGYMYHHVFFEQKVPYKVFLSAKFRGVISPYLALGTGAVFLLYVTKAGFFSGEVLFEGKTIFDSDDHTLITIGKYYLTGRMLTAYWYVPFAILLFSMAPLHNRFLLAERKHKLLIIIGLSLVSMFVHRSYENTNPLQMLIYFTPYYLIGMYTSLYRVSLADNLKVKSLFCVFLAFVLATYEASIGHQGNYIKPLFTYNGIDTMYLQKVFLVLGIYFLLEAFPFKLAWLSFLAKISFGVFFIHPWVLSVMKRTAIYQFTYQEQANVVLFVAVLVFVVSLSALIVVCSKRVLNSSGYSKSLIGY